MNLQELITAVSNKLPVRYCSEQRLSGHGRQLQDLFCGGRLNAVDIPDQPDFVKLAKPMGPKAYRVAKRWKILNHAPHRVCQRTRPSSTLSSSATTMYPTYRGFAGRNAVVVVKMLGEGTLRTGSLPFYRHHLSSPLFNRGRPSQRAVSSANAH